MTGLGFVLIVGLSVLACTTGAAAQTGGGAAQAVTRPAQPDVSGQDLESAIRLSESVLEKDSRNYSALLLLAVARARQGQHKAAATVAGRAFRSGTTDQQRLQAARIAGAAWFNAGRHARAEWWLRRAANHANTKQSLAQVKREFQAVRENNPFTLLVNFSVSPSNNVNGGAKDQFFDLGNIRLIFSPESVALSGIEYAADLNLIYRVSQDSTQVTEIGFYTYGRTYTLSPDAREQAPRAKGSDFSLAMVDLSVHHRRYLFRGLGPTGISAYTGQVWYGGAPLWRYNRLSLWQMFPSGPNATTTVRASVEDQKSLGQFFPDTTVYDLKATYVRRLKNRDILRLSLMGLYNDATRETDTFSETLARLDYVLAKPVMDTRLVFSLTAGRRSYDEFALSLDGRRDRYLEAGITAVFERASYYGFSPSFSVSAKRTISDVSRYSKLEVQGAVGFESNF